MAASCEQGNESSINDREFLVHYKSLRKRELSRRGQFVVCKTEVRKALLPGTNFNVVNTLA